MSMKLDNLETLVVFKPISGLDLPVHCTYERPITATLFYVKPIFDFTNSAGTSVMLELFQYT